MSQTQSLTLEFGFWYTIYTKGNVVQWLEHRPVTAEVAGSNPVIPELEKKEYRIILFRFCIMIIQPIF